MFKTTFAVFCSIITVSTSLPATIILDDVMTREDQYRTGVDKLKAPQKAALESWLNKNFIPKKSAPQDKKLFLSVNLESGKKLLLSDGTTYEIYPADVITTSVWLTPFPISVSSSGDITYPFMLTNVNTNVSVKARQVMPQNQMQPIPDQMVPEEMQQE
jgi:hypothetical protein